MRSRGIFFLNCVILGRRSIWIESTFRSRSDVMSDLQATRHSFAVSSPWTKTPSQKLNSGLCESLWPARSRAHVCSEDSSSMIRSQAHVGLSRKLKVSVDSSHRTERCGAHRNSLARYFCFDLSDVKCLQSDLGQSVRRLTDRVVHESHSPRSDFYCQSTHI